MESGERIQDRKWVKRLLDASSDSLEGYRVDATDGDAGRVEQVLYWSDTSTPDYVIVGTGRWIFGHKSVLPVQAIADIDTGSRRVRMRLTRDEIRQAPEYLPLT